MTCELTKVNGRAINSALNKQVLSNLIIPERVASSLREVFSDKYVIDETAQLALKEHILNWANTLLKMPLPDAVKQKINVIKDNIDSIVAIATSLNQSLNEPKTNTQMLVLDLEHFEILEQVEYSMLNQLYGTAQQARTEMQNTLRTNVIASMFVNFDEGYVVKDIEHLNKNITNFLERLYQTILQYAKLKGRSTSDTNLFVDGKFMNPKNLRVLADLLFSDFNGAKLNDLFANRALANEGLALRAYNAWVILNNFDMLLKNLLGKTIVINENYKGTFQDASKLKYQLSGESNLVKTWRTSEDVNAINELGSVTKLLVESAPVYQYNKNFGLEDLPDELLYGQTLELKDVMFAFALALEHPDLKNMHMLIRYNPMLYIPMFIQSALEVTYGNNDLQIKNILYSVYKRFFQLLHKDTDTLYSLALIMNSESAKTDYNVSNNLLSYITGMIDKTVPNNHLEYAIDSDTGFITTRYSSMNSLNTSKIMVLKTINNINDVLNDEDRDRLLERFKISQITDNPQVKTLFLIEFELDGTQYYIKFDNRKGELKFIEFDIVTNAGRLDYPKATGRTNDLEYKAKQALISLLDSTLHMSLAQRPELLDLLYDILPTTDPSMDKLVDSLLQLSLLAGRVLLKHEIDRGKYDDYKIDEMYGTDSNRYRKDWLNLKTGKILSVLNERQSGELVTKLAQALMIINGDIAKSTVRNLEGNQVAAEGLTNLINTVKTVWNDAKQLENSANQFCIFAQHEDLLNRVAIKSAAQSSDRLSVKADRDFNVGESGYTAIMLDFLTGYAKQMVGGQYTDGRGLMQFQPTVYSDKTTNCVLVIDGNTFIPEFNKKFINLTPEEVKQYHFSTMSDMYNLLKLNITGDYQLFFNAISHTPVLETSLRASGIEPDSNYTYEQFRDIIFPIINEFANSEYTAGTPFEGKSAVQVFDSIVKPESRVVVNVHYAGKKNLETNPVLDYHFMMYNKTDDSLYRQQVAKYLAKFAKHCLLNFRINWKNDRLEIDPKLKGAVARLGINETTYVSNWVDSKTGELIIAKTTDGRPLTRLDAESNFPENVELNPILDAFYSFDQIVSTLFITSTVGGCYGHKNNFKSTDLTPGTLEYMEEEEAGRTLTLFKRMVIYPATMHNYQQELVQGCATKIKVAAIADIQAQVYNFLDAQDDIDAHDGSGFCLPWVSDWENGSLGESAAGEDKKTIGHSMDGKYLMESEFKWALFSLTNERIRNSGRVSGVNLKLLVRKMGNIAWNTNGRPFDFTKDPTGKTVNLLLFGKDVFFRATDLYTAPIQDDFGAIDYLFEVYPELAQIGTKEEYLEYLHTIYPDSNIRDIYWHGTNSDLSQGFLELKAVGSGAPETGEEVYFNRQPYASLQYINGINRTGQDVEGFAHWNKLYWELKEILGKGRYNEQGWRTEIINDNTVRQQIPNKAGVFNRDLGGKNGSYLSERKTRYGYENRTDEDFFREVFGLNYGNESFNDWLERNKQVFLEIWKSGQVKSGMYPALINSTNPITESGLNTYYEEQRGLFTQARLNGNDTIISNNADNEFNSDVAIAFDRNNVHLLGTAQDLAGFLEFKNRNNKQVVIPGRFYKVQTIQSTEIPNIYNITLIEVNSTGKAIGDSFIVQKEIDSNYKLWEAFGAEYSMELYTDITGESSLINSNSSSLLVAFYGNRAGYLRSLESEGMYKDVKEHPDHEFFYEPNTYSDDPTFKTDAELRANRALWTQRDVYLPMKYSDISYAVNPSAIKNGLTNVNPRSSWYDNTELTSFWISTKHFGVLMDADHHADDAELTEMSLVISALESNGYTHHIAKEAYRDLGAIVYAQLKPYMQAIEQHYKGDGRALYEVVGKAFLDSFQNSSSNRSDLADALVYNLKQKLGNGDSLIDAEVWIPFSDTTVLSKLISTITSLINKSAIKRKYAGIASVMVPAYDLIKIYKHLTPDGRMIDATYGGMVNTIGTTDGVRLHLNDLTENSPVLTKWDLELGKSYINLNTGERFTINTLDLYYELRSFAAPDPIQYKEDFTQGRNLQPARTTYQLKDMEGTYDIYDVDAVTNKLRFSKWYSGYKKASDKVQYLINSLQLLLNISDIANNENIDRVLLKMYNTGDITKLDFYVKQIGQFLQQDIVTAFHNLHEESFVVIDGQIHYVKEGTLQLQEAELVLSKIYATKFGLKPGTYLNDINEKFFLDQIRSLLTPKNELYGIALKKANGRHTYIVSNTKEEIQRLINFGYVQQDPPVRITENGTFRTDSETGEIIGPFNDCQLYVSSNGDEIIVTNDVQQFLDNDDYESILVNANNSPEMYVGILTTLDSDLVEVYKQPYNEQLLANIAKNEEKVITRAARRKWTSFLKSLEFTAARIPSQSMQSFMPMKVVGFTDSDENKAYVSHFQTFLLGSDYDIDKVYLLGNEFDDAGMYIGWSPLFDLSDIRLQKKSEELPMPTGKEIILVERNENHEANAYVQTILGIRRLLANRNLTEELRIDLKEQYLQAMSEFLNQINESDTQFVYFNPQDPNLRPTEKELNWLERTVNRHQTYLSRVNDDRLVKMTKNSVSSKIRRIINDPHNMVAAYSPIEMNAPREAARKSTMGNEEREYGQLNPAVKWILHEQNMVGKKAIGITAVGEKVLFALLHYYNEVARMGGDLGRIKQIRALFNKRIPLIKGSGDEKISIIRNIIANVNLLNTNPIWYEYINNELASIQRLSLPSLVEDPLTGETTEIAPPSLKQEDADFLSELLLMLVIAMEDSALINSALLSAATDNAKELILSKINANPDMLKIYTYCIVLGIDFNYIAELMTSSTVNTISKLAKNNIFDPRYYTKSIDTVVRTIHKGIDLERYGLKKIPDEENIPGAKEYNEIYATFKGDEDQGITPFWDKVFKSAFKGEASFKDCVEMIGLPLLTSLKSKADSILPDTTDSIMMHRYLLEVEELLNYMQNINGNDLQLFEDLLESGEELNLFGRVLGINQGIRTNMADKIAYLDNFEDIFAKRLAKNAELKVEMILTKQPQLEHFGVTPEMVQATIDEALKLGMIVYNKETQSYVSNFNALKFIQDEHYKEVAIDMYDYIKNTINVFDVIDTVPHFKAMVKAAAVDFILFDENSSKFALAYNLSREVKAGQRGLNKKQRTLVDRDIVNFLSQVVTNNYFRDKGLFLSLTCDYYDERGTLHINENKEPNIIDLSTPHGLATFKHWFTTVVIPRLKKGMSSHNSDSISEGLKTNKFISDLLLTTSERTLTRDLQYIWTLPINMSNTKSVTDTNNFVGYLGAFTMLENYEYEGVNLVQLFSWYNLLVYKNQYGQDSLTRIFENYMSRPGNVMLDYFDYVGKVDYNKLLSANDFDVEDVKVNCAPEVSIWQTLQNQYLGDYIKVRDRATNTLRIYKYNAQRAAELRKKSGNVEDDPYQDYLNDMNLDYEGEDEGSIPELRPLVYDLVEPLDTNKKDIINDFAIITPSTMTYKIAKAATTILRELFNQRKVFIFNNCG